MKKLLVLFVFGLLAMTAMAQQSALIGSWQQLDANGFPTTSVKIFMPDGKLLGQSFNNDFTVSSVWFMSDYKMLNDSSYVDHAFYHSSTFYQRDYLFTFHKENDSVLVSTYTDYRNNGVGVVMRERWKKMDRPLPVFTDAEWEALHQKSLAEFDRLPKDGQTVEQYAEELMKKALDDAKARKFDRLFESLLIRAELDTTNLQWQKDAFGAFMDTHVAPSIAEKMCNRVIRLTEAAAPAPADTSVTYMYRLKALMYANRGVYGLESALKTMEKLVELEDLAGVPTSFYGYDCSNIALTYLGVGDFANCYKYAAKSVDIYEQVPDAKNSDKGNAYFMKVKALANTDRLREAIDLAYDKVVPLYTNEQGEPDQILSTEVYPYVYACYEQLIEKTPEDKKLLKEYQQFMSDKLLYAVFKATDKDLNLFGEYLVLEKDEWTLEKPVHNISDAKHFLLLKGDEYVELDVKENLAFKAAPVMKTVDAVTKKDIIRQWKAYKNSKKVKK